MLILGLLFMQSVEYVECNQNYLILTDEQTTYHIDFFNVIFYKEENRLEACRYLEDAEKSEIEEENLHNFEKKEQKVMANYENISRNNRSFYILGFLFLFLMLSLFLTFVSKV